MVKKVCLLIILLFTIVSIAFSLQPSQADSFEELLFGFPTEEIGDKIATRGGWRVIEFWHYSGGYWKATTDTGGGLRELVISDDEVDEGAWADLEYLVRNIYENGFVLEYQVLHPQEVLDSISNGATITPVININKDTLHSTDENIDITDFFNFGELPPGLPSDLPEKPEYIMDDTCIIIRALPKLTCLKNTNLKKEILSFPYPHSIPLVQPGFGSLSYAMFHHSGEHTGVGYSPDPYYDGMHTIPYSQIKDIQGRLNPGFLVTTQTNPYRTDEPSDDLKIGDGTFANAGAISIRFWYPIKVDYYALNPPTVTPTPPPTEDSEPPEPETSDAHTPLGNNDLDAETVCAIRADDRGDEQFDVDQGIPVRENLYANILTKEYLVSSLFTEHNHTESLPVKVKKTYNLSWTEDHGHDDTTTCGSGTYYHVNGTYCQDSDGDGIKDSCPGHSYTGCRDSNGDGVNDYCPGHSIWIPNLVDMTDTEVVYSDAHTVTRSYSYWTVDSFEAFVPDSASVSNDALPGGNVLLQATGIPEPSISISNSLDTDYHVLNSPMSDAISDGSIIYDETEGCYIVDLGVESLSGGSSRPVVPGVPDYVSKAEAAVSNFKTRNDRLIFNGETIVDNTISNMGDTPNPKDIPESTLCHPDAFYKNQLTIPDTTLNGTHPSSGNIEYRRLGTAVNPAHSQTITLPIDGINDVTIHTPVVCNSGVKDDYANDQTLNPDRNRAALVLGRPSHIRFLTIGEHLDIPGYNTDGVMDCRKYTRDRQVKFPFDVYIGTDQPINACFVPKDTWYSISMDASFDELDITLPTWVPEGDHTVEFREIAANAPDMDQTEVLANKDITKYVAVRTSPVRVVGRMYGFRITDITDKLWQEVFRVSEDSSSHTGNYYYVGTKNEEGQERGNLPLFTLPILEGSHPIYKNRGALKTGYTFRFELVTSGEYYSDTDYVRIVPRFYYIKKDGTGRQEVDLWYHDDFDGKMNYYVKIEPSGRNRDNPLMMVLGDDYRNVPESEINDTCRILAIDRHSFQKDSHPIGWFDRIVLSPFQRTFIGPKASLPPDVDTDTAIKSVQRWYGEYYLPNDLFVATKDFDVAEYGRTHNGLDGKESFWLKDGYIIVNFQMETVQQDDFEHPVLRYWGAPYCNMFEREGFSDTKTDYYGTSFNLQHGDIIFYDTDKRSSDDYRTGGTH